VGESEEFVDDMARMCCCSAIEGDNRVAHQSNFSEKDEKTMKANVESEVRRTKNSETEVSNVAGQSN
jgi:hypothetical protein